MEGNNTDLLAGGAGRKAKRTKGKLTRQKEKSGCSRADKKTCLQRTENLTESQGKNKDNLGRNPGMKTGK